MSNINTPRPRSGSDVPISPLQEVSPKRITHTSSLPISFSKAPSFSSRFSQLKEKLLPNNYSTGLPTSPKSSSLRNTARRLSGSQRRPESLPPVPGRRKEITYTDKTDEDEVIEDKQPLSPERSLQGPIDDLSIKTDGYVLPIIPEALVNGLSMIRLTHKKKGLRVFRINPVTYELSWDSKASSRCSIDNIEDIREGEEAKSYREAFKVASLYSSRWATIVYHYQTDNRSKRRLLHVLAQSMADYRLFIGTLKRVAIYRQNIGKVPGLPQDALLEDWTKYASPVPAIHDECVTIDGVQKILRTFYIYCSQSFLKEKFAEVDTKGSGHLTFAEFEKLVQMLKVRPDIQDLFEATSDICLPESKVSAISEDALFAFCKTVQRMEVNESTFESLFERFSLREGSASGVNVEGFTKLLMSESFMPLINPPIVDLTQPMTDYFISSSHNTYLVGRQLAGVSSIEPYIQVLQDGCRCIEIDIWDSDEGPIVNHGRTFTSSVSFLSVIDTINVYAFRDFPLPIILSLEVHCNIENQHKMVDIMKDVFKDKLVTEQLKVSQMPSPEELMNRVLVKVKAGSSQHGTQIGSTVSGIIPTFASVVLSGSDGGSSGSTPTASSATDSSLSELDEESEAEIDDAVIKKSQRDAVKCNISERLGALGVYLQGIKFRNFALPVSKTFNHCFSFSEEKINTLIKDETLHAQLIKHNRKFFLRVYPSGYRVTSSNYDPIPYWKRGAQMVSLNWQTYGELTTNTNVEALATKRDKIQHLLT